MIPMAPMWYNFQMSNSIEINDRHSINGITEYSKDRLIRTKIRGDLCMNLAIVWIPSATILT